MFPGRHRVTEAGLSLGYGSQVMRHAELHGKCVEKASIRWETLIPGVHVVTICVYACLCPCQDSRGSYGDRVGLSGNIEDQRTWPEYRHSWATLGRGNIQVKGCSHARVYVPGLAQASPGPCALGIGIPSIAALWRL